jgi:hypothetical protein
MLSMVTTRRCVYQAANFFMAKQKQHLGQPGRIDVTRIMDASVSFAFGASRDTLYEVLEVGFAGRCVGQRVSRIASSTS